MTTLFEALSMVAIIAAYVVLVVAFIEGDRIVAWLARRWRALKGR